MTLHAQLSATLDSLFPSSLPTKIAVAVSGGSDSLSLMYLAADWAAEQGLTVHAVTVDHGLRAESATEAVFVADQAHNLGLVHDCLHWTGWDGQGNLQDAARRARYGLMADWAREKAISHVLLAHTMDDQAETFLMRLARGAGVDGLAGMRPAFDLNDVTFVRPLLATRRQDLRDFLKDQGASWVDDPSNTDDRFDRVKARQALAALQPLGIDASNLSRSMANICDTKASISAHLGDWAAQNVTLEQGDLCMAVDPFLALPKDFARRLLGSAFQWVSGTDYPPRAVSISQILTPPIQQVSTLHGCLVDFRGPVLRIGREPAAALRAAPVPTTQIWDSRWQLDGPHADDVEIRALGADGLRDCPDWRDTGHSRASLMASPGIWRDQTLVSAPIAGYGNGWTAKLAPKRADFAGSLIRR